MLAAACTFEGSIVRTDMFLLRVPSSLPSVSSPQDSRQEPCLLLLPPLVPTRFRDHELVFLPSPGAPSPAFLSDAFLFLRTALALLMRQASSRPCGTTTTSNYGQHTLRELNILRLLVSTRSPQRPPGSPPTLGQRAPRALFRLWLREPGGLRDDDTSLLGVVATSRQNASAATTMMKYNSAHACDKLVRGSTALAFCATPSPIPLSPSPSHSKRANTISSIVERLASNVQRPASNVQCPHAKTRYSCDTSPWLKNALFMSDAARSCSAIQRLVCIPGSTRPLDSNIGKPAN